jgi:hypothetical protein
MAKKLMIQISEITLDKTRRDIVHLTLPIQSLDQIEDYISPEVKELIIKHQVSIDAVRKKFYESGALPSKLFELSEGARNYSVRAE